MLMPCGSLETLEGGKEDRIPDDCNYNKQAMLDYLGPLNLIVYYNTGEFQLD